VTLHKLEQQLPIDIIQELELYRVSKGEYLCRQGHDLNQLFLLVEGRLQVDAIQAFGNQAVFSFESPLSIIGDLEVFDSQQALCNVQTLEPCQVFAISMTAARQNNHPLFLRFIARSLGRKVYFSTHLQAQSSFPLEYRLTRYLLYKMTENGRSFKLENREALAALLGTSTRHLNRTLAQLETSGAIRFHNKTLDILHPEVLEVITLS
jgi:CRP/FNR family transcriptional regulator, putaive post-exponential-phase nitrogen-starvation regulator